MSPEALTSTFWDLVTADMYIIIAAVYGVCYALKKARFFDDRFIPLAALVLGVIFQLLSLFTTKTDFLSAFLKGIICGMAAVFTANVVKQIRSGNSENNNV
jgi:hypothetical protein